jgi:PLP dependent protein
MALAEILTRMRAAERAAGRAEGSVKLIAVSKVQPAERVKAVLDEGHRVFGENYVQEAAGKWPAWRDRFGPVELHMIGPLQTNKAKLAVEFFDVIRRWTARRWRRSLPACNRRGGPARSFSCR